MVNVFVDGAAFQLFPLRHHPATHSATAEKMPVRDTGAAETRVGAKKK